MARGCLQCLLIAHCLAACGSAVLRPTTFDPEQGVAVVRFGSFRKDSEGRPLTQPLCLAELRDGHGVPLALPENDGLYEGPLELNPGTYELVVRRCILLCSDELSHHKLVFNAVAGRAYRVDVAHEINILEAISLEIEIHDESVGAPVTHVGGDECSKNLGAL